MIDFLMEEEGKRDHADDVCEMDDVIPGEVEWSRGEDEYLQKIVGLYGTEEWRTIMEKFNNRFCNHSRTEAECRNRWNEFLDPRNSKKPWDDNEQFMMLVAHKKFKNKWSDVATTLPGRSGNTIKNRFYCIFRKVKNKILKFDLSYTSKFELLEILYMISLMEQYSVV